MIDKLGFLSPEASEDEQQVIINYHELFTLSERLSELFISLVKKAPLDQTSIINMVMHGLALKALELFQAAVIILRKGCIPAAKVLCRAQIETVYKLCAIQLDHHNIDLYIDHENITRLLKLKGIQKYKQKHPKSGVYPEIEKEIDTLTKRTPKQTKPHKWASLAKMDDFHNLYYQGMSDDAHGNIESLNHYFDNDSDHIMSFGPSDKQLPFVAAACHRTFINAIEKYALFNQVDITTALDKLNKENDLLEDKYYNMQNSSNT